MKCSFFFVVLITSILQAQQLPLQIGNEWHYVKGLGPNAENISKAVDTTIINGKTYLKIEHKAISDPRFDAITYDRIEGDSTYYRIYSEGEHERLIFNFNYVNGQIISTPSEVDSTCQDLFLIQKYSLAWEGILMNVYQTTSGGFCPWMTDTSWALSGYGYTDFFGCLDASDGRFIGAKINGIVYGVLHPVPVELMFFSKEVIDNSIKLQWSTASETNNYGFEILRDFGNDSMFVPIGFIKGHGTKTEQSDYEYIDKELPKGEYGYKLIQIDYDGKRKEIAQTSVNIIYPLEFSLSQNYPNPFNPFTRINFSIPIRSKVRLNVYNLLGEKVAVLIDELKEAGNYQVDFDGSRLPSGVYFYQISAGDYKASKKLILLK